MAEAVFNFLREHKGLPFRTMAVFNWLLEAALLGGLLVLAVLLVRALLRRQAGNRVICIAWVLVAVRLLVPVALPNPLMNEFKPTYSTDVLARPVADQFRVRFIDAMSDLAWRANVNDTLARFDAPYDVANMLSDVAAYTSYGWLGKWYFYAYVAGVGGVAVYMLCRNLAFRRRLRATRRGELAGEALRAYHLLCDELGLQPVPVTLHAGLPDACLVGVFRPYVALPEGLGEEPATQGLRRVLAQRKAHANAWALLRNVCCALQWFNPLVWVAAFLSRQDQLYACDEQATARLLPADRAAYAKRLTELAGKAARPALSVLATPMTLRAPAMRRRADALVAPAKPQHGAQVGVLVGLCVLTLLSFFVANTGFPAASNVTWLDEAAFVDAGPYSTAQYPNISVEKAAEYARQDMIDMEGIPAEEIRPERLISDKSEEGPKFFAFYTLKRDEAGEGGLAYLNKWAPGADECTLVWVFSDYDTIVSKGRLGSYTPDASDYRIESDLLTSDQALGIAREALVAHWGMSEADAQEAAADGTPTLQLDDPYFEGHGWPTPYWKVYLNCNREPGAPCRLVCIDAATGRVFLFYDFVQNG